MRVLNAQEDSGEIIALLDQVDSEPVLIRRNDCDAAVMLSPARYREIQQNLTDALIRLMNDMGRQAQENGLTPEILDEILAEAKAERTQ